MVHSLSLVSSSVELDLASDMIDEEDGGTYAARSRAVSSLAETETSGVRDRGSFYEPEGEAPPLESFWENPPLTLSTTSGREMPPLDNEI